MFDDVVASRAMRALIISDPSIATDRLSCPICHRRVWDHNSSFWTGDHEGEGHVVRIPCYRRNEWDRYNLHINPTDPRTTGERS